jgi:aspartate kinase
MALVVQKFGGTSVGTLDRIKRVARRAVATQAAGHRLIVVVSAMAGETDRLLKLADEASGRPDLRERDVLVSTGEQVTIALLAMAIRDLGCPATSFLGSQVPIVTDSAFGAARIHRIDSVAVLRALDNGHIVVVAGFQGVDRTGNVTTLGRGGSDTTAVAIAAAVGAASCEIYTDVEGVFTSDPRLCPQAKKLARISYDEMLELASLGAKVLQNRSVEFAKRYRVPLHVRSSFNDEEGTWVVSEEQGMEEVNVAGVTHDRNQAKITLLRVPDRPGLAARIFGLIASANIIVDMIVQTGSADGTTDLTFTLHQNDHERALELIRPTAQDIGAAGVTGQTGIAKVSIVGLGMRSHAGIAARMFEILAREGINIQLISTSEIKVSVAIDAKYTELAVRVLHDNLVTAPPGAEGARGTTS